MRRTCLGLHSRSRCSVPLVLRLPPPLGMVSFVDQRKVRHKRDPGRCYLKAGFRLVGTTRKAGLLAFQLLPADMPPALAPIGAQMEMSA